MLSPREVFEHKTVRALAAVAVGGGGWSVASVGWAPGGGGVGEVVLSPIVSWMVDTAVEPGIS